MQPGDSLGIFPKSADWRSLMSFQPRVFPRVWIIVLICACGFLYWCDHARVRRVREVSAMIEGAKTNGTVSGIAAADEVIGQRQLIVPGRNERSFDWIAQTQQMFVRHEARVRHIDYENPPQGRAVNAASPYRWWLGFVAWIDQLVSGRSITASVENAAIWADPALHFLFLIGGAFFVARRFGGLAAILFSIGVVTLFPFAGDFLPGMPDDRGLSHLIVIASLLTLLAGMISANEDEAVVQPGWFAAAGVIGGLGVWVDVTAQIPVIAGVFVGGILVSLTAKIGRAKKAAVEEIALPWRMWSLAGAATVLVAYLIEYFPAHFELWRLESVHPFYGLAWIGLGECLGRLDQWIRGEKYSGKGVLGWIAPAVSLLALAAIPVVMWKTGSRAFLARDLSSLRLTALEDGAVATSVWTWISREGMSATVWATLLPVLVLIPVAWTLFRSSTKPRARFAVTLIFGPALVLLGFASQQLGDWSRLDAVLLVLLVATFAGRPLVFFSVRSWVCAGAVAGVAMLGITRLMPSKLPGAGGKLTASESQELIERHLAHWLARHAGESGAVVYAPPRETATLCFYGGLRGVGTFAPENREGFGAALMIAAAKTMEEAQGLLLARSVRYIVIPSWDPFFDEFAQRYLAKNFSNRTSLLAQELRRWNLPPWLRPIPYQIPIGGGFEGESVLVFEVVDEQSPSVAAGRLAEYLVETGELDQAVVVAETLRRFPGDVGALVARAQVQAAKQDGNGFAQTLTALQARLSNGADRFLPWDRRVSLAIVLARANQVDAARGQLQRCLAEADGKKLRSLTTGSLYGLEVLTKAFELNISDPTLNALALSLLPRDLRERL
jgi:hypothetical protein